jgi:large subunit ribosomal protein L31e
LEKKTEGAEPEEETIKEAEVTETEDIEPEEETIKEAEITEAETLEEEKAEEEEIFEVEEKSSRRKEEEEKFVEERIYTVPLRRAWNMPANKRAPKSMRIIKAFVQKHMKVGVETSEEDEEEGGRVIIKNEVNQKIWSQGIEKPPRKVRIRVAKDEEGNVTVFLA